MINLFKKTIKKTHSYLGRESASYILSLTRTNNTSYAEHEGIKLITEDSEALDFLGGLRVESKSYKKWIALGSYLVIKKTGEIEPSPRGWVHFKGSRNVSGFSCSLDEFSAWLGPDFVPKDFRGNGYQKKIIDSRVKETFKQNHIEVLFTGINVTNIPSLKSYLQCGFSIDGLLRSRRFLFWTFSEKLLYTNTATKHLTIK